MVQAETDKRHVYAVLLAAGASRRFAGMNKLMEEIDGIPLVRRVAERLLHSRLDGVIVVTGFEADHIANALRGLEVRIARNRAYSDGLASSLRCGVAAVSEKADGAMIVLADMPDISPEFIDRLLEKFVQGGCESIVYPVNGEGSQGNPVIWPARFFAALQELTGDTGAKHLIARHPGETLPVSAESDALLRDIDTPGDLAAWRGQK